MFRPNLLNFEHNDPKWHLIWGIVIQPISPTRGPTCELSYFLSNFNAVFFLQNDKMIIFMGYWWTIKNCFAILFLKGAKILKFHISGWYIEFLFFIQFWCCFFPVKEFPLSLMIFVLFTLNCILCSSMFIIRESNPKFILKGDPKVGNFNCHFNK